MTGIATHASRLFAELLAHPALWRGNGFARVTAPSLPTGFPELDAELPGGGWPTGRLTEILPVHEGIGELLLLGSVLAGLSAAGKRLVWIAPPHRPYAPALAAAGIELQKLIIVRTRTAQETLWAVEQALASHACGAVLAWPSAVKYSELRRLQLAAEGSNALAVLFRSEKAAAEPSPASLRIALASTAGGLAVHILKRRGAPLDRPVVLPAVLPATAAATTRAHDHAVDFPSPARTAARSAAARFAAA
jgi:cell division inhibitor SulA/protein ImuA